MPTYTKVKKLNLFKEAKEPGSRRPDYGNSKVIFEVALAPGRYSFSGWQYEDTGNIALEIQRVTEDDDHAASYTTADDGLTEQGAVKHSGGLGNGGFDD